VAAGLGPYVAVAVARPIDGPLTYAAPAHIGGLRVGHAVLVPLGGSLEVGWVVGAEDADGLDPAQVKSVARLLDPIPAFDDTQLDLFRWMSRYYLAPLGLVLQTALPSTLGARVVHGLEVSEVGRIALTIGGVPDACAVVLRGLIERPGLTARGLGRRVGDLLEPRAFAGALGACGRRQWVNRVERTVGTRRGRVAFVGLTVSADAARASVRAAAGRQRAVIEALAAGPVEVAALDAALGASARPAVQRLVAAGLAAVEQREQRDVLAEAPPLGASEAPPLRPAQQDALAQIRSGPPRTWLLFGVTGSGKTEVFLGATAEALARGRQVLILVPEIGLTPQLVGRFRARFGRDVAVLHSGLLGSERLAEWRRVRAGEARVVVGARSAVFAPFSSLGLVVVDEEHDDSYKQDEGVSYSARDVAVVLGQRCSCPVLLASATPSLESWNNAHRGRYGLLRLPERATPRPLPEVALIDLAAWPGPGERPILLPEAVDALREAVDDGGQAIVLYNRRGWATLVECTHCGGTYECPSCALSMTLHRARAEVVCHACGLHLPYDGRCPRCRRNTLDERGKGTERVVEAVVEALPGVSVARMDADSTVARGSHAQILDAFREGRTRVLVGTQMVAKGHDFPDVRTVVIVSADQPLRLPDFRAAERTWALLVQASGRAGRGDRPGRVVVQTWRPDHYAVASVHDPEAFLGAEMRVRATLRYPPYARLCLIRLEGADGRAVRGAAESLVTELRTTARGHPGVAILGPAPAALPRVSGRWRWQVVLRGESAAFRPWLQDVARPAVARVAVRGLRVAVDVDPRSLM
jgi:primosomal protein N' (replication factor Y)